MARMCSVRRNICPARSRFSATACATGRISRTLKLRLSRKHAPSSRPRPQSRLRPNNGLCDLYSVVLRPGWSLAMKAIIVGGGIGGLTTALMLRARGIDCEIYEQSDTVRELGVGINTLPHAIRELAGIGLLDRLDDAAIRTYELFYLTRHGQQVWYEKRGLDAGHEVPQFSIHRGRLQGVIHQAVVERLGSDAVKTGCRLGAFTQDEGGVTAYFFDRGGAHTHTARGDILIGADGIHSKVRQTLFPEEGPPCWNGLMLWRGAADWAAFLTGRSMIIAGGLNPTAVVYPIAEGSSPASSLTNWAVLVRIGDGSAAPPRKVAGAGAGQGR